MTDELIQHPYVLQAAPCTFVEEPGGSTFKECYTGLELFPAVMPEQNEININVVFCGGEKPNAHTLTVDYLVPGREKQSQEFPPLVFAAPYEYQLMHFYLPLEVVDGTHFYDIRVGGRLVTRVPLMVVVREGRPPLAKMKPYPERKRTN